VSINPHRSGDRARADSFDEQVVHDVLQVDLVFGATATSPFTLTPTARRAQVAWKGENQRRLECAEDAESVELLAPITLHECRHTFASLMIAAGVNAKALSAYMGHSTISITYDRYGHLLPGNEAEAADLLDAYLARADTAARLAQIELETGTNTGTSDDESAL
jgi:integrase